MTAPTTLDRPELAALSALGSEKEMMLIIKLT